MSKRKAESTSDCEDFSTDISNNPNILVGSGGEKKGRNVSTDSEQREQTPVASTSTQLPRERIVTFKDEEEGWMENEVEHIEEEYFPERMIVARSSSAAGQQSQPEVRRSGRERALSKLFKVQQTSSDLKMSSKKVSVPKPHEKYFKGCVVMGRVNGCAFCPGMILKAGADYKKYPDVTQNRGGAHRANYQNFATPLDIPECRKILAICPLCGGISFCVQFFYDETSLYWLTPVNLRVFDVAKPNRYNPTTDPTDVVKFEKALRIARAAVNFPVEERLAKFNLPRGALIDNLLREIDEWSVQQAPKDGCLQSGTQEGNDPPPSTQGNGRTCTDSVAQKDDEPVAPTNGNGESCPDSVEIMMMERIAVYKQKLREECHREKDEEIRILTNDQAKLADENDKLKATLKEQAEMISQLQDRLEKEKLDRQKEVETEKEEKLKCKQETEKYKAAFEKMFPI